MKPSKAIKKITETVNKNRKLKSCWLYIAVEVIHPVPEEMRGKIEPEREFEIHEIFFDKKGIVTGITSNEVTIGASTRKELASWLVRASKNIATLPAVPCKYFKYLKH